MDEVPRVRFFLCAVAVLLAAGTAEAQRVYDVATTPRAKFVAPAAPYPGPSYRAKDFTILKKGDYYHLFYTRVRRFQPLHYGWPGNETLNECTFGHAISPDLENWTSLDTVLTVHPGEWDAHHLWSPTLVEKDGVTWMFYTGVRDTQMTASPTDWLPRRQTIGAAYSTDPLLQEWTRVPTPQWQPCQTEGMPGVSWAVCNPNPTFLPRGTADFRDPFVLTPPGPGQPWLLYYTALPRSDQWNHVVGVAQAGGGPGSAWSDVGALWDVFTPSANSKLESPHVLEHEGRWLLFITGDDGSPGILWSSALHPATGPWQSNGPIANLLEGKKDEPYDYTLEPEYWFASEAFSEQGPSTRADYFCVVHAYDAPPEYNPPPPATPEDFSIIEFRQILWRPNGTFDLVAPNPVRAIEGPLKARLGEPCNLVLNVEYGGGRVADLLVLGPGGVPVDNASIGLPATVPLSGSGATLVPWTPHTSALTLPAQLEVRVANQPLRVACSITLDVGEGGPDEPLRELPVSRGAPTGRDVGPPPILDYEPLGYTVRATGARDILVTLPAAARAQVAVYDVAGRRVRVLRDETLPGGSTIAPWDGRDDGGRAVRRGVYFARVTTPFGQRTARFLVLE